MILPVVRQGSIHVGNGCCLVFLSPFRSVQDRDSDAWILVLPEQMIP